MTMTITMTMAMTITKILIMTIINVQLGHYMLAQYLGAFLWMIIT